MPSESAPSPARAEASRWAWLWSQGLGILCGQATVLLLAVGSIVLAATRDGASAALAMDDLRAFVEQPSPAHAWLYLLVPVLALYALNAALATWRSVARKWRSGMRAPSAFAAAVIHASFLLGLVAHLVGGLWGAEGGTLILGPGWQDLGDGRRARLAALDTAHHPDGSLKQAWAQLELEEPDGTRSAPLVHYNGPLSSGLGSELFLLARAGAVPGAARLVREADRCEVEVEDSCNLGGLRAQLLYVHPLRERGAGALVRIRLWTETGSTPEEFWLARGHAKRLADGSSLALEGVAPRPAVQLRRRHAPGNPWALAASVLLTLGLGLMWRRFL